MLGRGFQYGPYFQCVRRLWLNPAGDDVLAWIEGDTRLADDASPSRLHPTVFDASLQTLLTPLGTRGDTDLYIPTGIRHLALYRAAQSGFCATASSRKEHRESPRAMSSYSTEKAMSLPKPMACVPRPSHRTIGETNSHSSTSGSITMYGRAHPHQAGRFRTAIGWCLRTIRAARSPWSNACAPAARQRYGVARGPHYSQLGADEFQIDPLDAEGMLRLVEQVICRGGSLAGAAYFWGLDTPAQDPGESGVPAETLGAVHLLQAIERSAGGAVPRLAVVTRHAQSVRAEALESMSQAPLVGLVRVAVNEYPAIRMRAIDIDDDAATHAALCEEILADDVEDEVALRGTTRFVHRLARRSATDLDRSVEHHGALFAADGTHLITGGCGGFGLAIAQWMVEQGARHLVLAGRGGANTAEARQIIERLRARGAQVTAVAADISKEADVERLLADIHRDLPPLSGVYHAAAVLDDGPIGRIDRQQIANAMGAKASGAWHLHRLTQDLPLKHFVLFSSIACADGAFEQRVTVHRRLHAVRAAIKQPHTERVFKIGNRF